MNFIDWIKQPWPWYVAGPLLGLTVPILLLIGNKSFGVSSSLRHICASCMPAKIPFFQYNWKKEVWNLFFVGGIFMGGVVTTMLLTNPQPVEVHPELVSELAGYGINNFNHLVPPEIFNWDTLFSVKGLIMMVLGGFLVGLGTRYAGGCTSGHAIMGISTLQWPSVVAACCFIIGGALMANFILPHILSL